MDHPCGRSRAPPYLVLLRAGFCLPPLLPEARCALTAPFHPYPLRRAQRLGRGLELTKAGGIFSVPLVRRVAPPGSYPAHCPAGVRTFLSRRRFPRPPPPCEEGRLGACRRQRSSGSLRQVSVHVRRRRWSRESSGVGSRESGVGSRESGVGSRESARLETARRHESSESCRRFSIAPTRALVSTAIVHLVTIEQMVAKRHFQLRLQFAL